MFFVKLYEFIDAKDSENAFEFASFNSIYLDQTFDEFKKSITKGISENDYGGFFYGLKNFSFLLIIIITFLVLLVSFTNKIYVLRKFTIINLILLMITILCLFLEGLFETINQIKWGYYLFLIVQILLFYFLNKKIKYLKK